MWNWDQSSGILRHNGTIAARGYSGLDAAKNNPLMQDAKGLGPIPCGKWRLTGICNSKNTGPATIALQPEPGTETFGRSAFRIHGDSILHPGSASHGCIILPRPIRHLMWDSGDHELEVVG